MDRLKVAVVVEENVLPGEGGGYSYFQLMIKEIDKFQFAKDIEIVFLVTENWKSSYPLSKPLIKSKSNIAQRAVLRVLNKSYRIIHRLFPGSSHKTLEFIAREMSRLRNYTAAACLQRNEVDIIYYLKPNDYPLDFPMIVTHWDVGHKSMYPFPEVAQNGNYQKRDSYYMNILKRAFIILCESNAGAAELSCYYPVNTNRVKVLPLFAGEIIDLKVDEELQCEILGKYNLKSRKFFVYPAQFWAHKNHFNLVRAFSQFRQDSPDEEIKLVLCGGDQGNMSYIKSVIASHSLFGKVIVTGFVSNDSLYTFYRHAISLVMPTYLGPTNIPLIEAAMLRCPVICSDFEGHREILGDAALYFNPAAADEIEDAMRQVINEDIRLKLLESSFLRISRSPFQLKTSMGVLQKILQDILPVRKAWGKLPGVVELMTYANIGLMDF